MLGRFANSQANDRGTLKVGLSKPPVIMSSGATSAPAVPKDATAPLAQRLPAVVDRVPEVAGAGIILIDAKGSRTLRIPKTAGQPYIVFPPGSPTSCSRWVAFCRN